MNPPNTLMLTGYLGKSAAENYIRLYFDEELSDYVDIPQEAVLHTRQLPPTLVHGNGL